MVTQEVGGRVKIRTSSLAFALFSSPSVPAIISDASQERVCAPQINVLCGKAIDPKDQA